MKKLNCVSLLVSWSIISSLTSLGQIIVVNDANGDGVADGSRQLLPNTADQQIRVYVTGGTAVQGINLNVQVADGGPTDGPNITNVDLIGNSSEPTIFFTSNNGQDPIRSDEQVWSVSLTTKPSETVNANGLLAIVTVSTVGWTSSTWDFSLDDTLEGPTDFTVVPATITDGSLTVVPEPSSGLAVASVLLASGWFWRRRRSR